VSADTTDDALFAGALSLVQPRSGYRFNVDALWLAEFAAQGRRLRHVLDLGAGVGAVTLVLNHRVGVARATLVEKSERHAELARRNLARAGVEGVVLAADVARAELPRGVDLVVANPPWFEPGERRPARQDREPARAGELAPFVGAAARALGSGRARAAFVYPARSLARLLALAEANNLVPKRLCFVHPFASEPARAVLVELRAAKPGGLVVEPALVEWAARGVPSPALAALNSPRLGGSVPPPPRPRFAR